MKPAAKVGLMLAALAVLGGIAWWQSRRADEAEATQAVVAEATSAMKELVAKEKTFPPALQSATSQLTSAVIVQPARGAAVIRTSILPLVDAHLATVDRAVDLGTEVQRRRPDSQVEASLEQIRKRGAVLRDYRGKLADLAVKIDNGATTEQIANGIMSAGWSLILPPPK